MRILNRHELNLFENDRPFVLGETARYLKQYFKAEYIPSVEGTFCNPAAIPIEPFNEEIDYLVKHTELHKGKILELWPWGYKVSILGPTW